MINFYDPHHFTLICELFNACNLNCDFCVKRSSHQDTTTDINYITHILPESLKNTILPELVERDVNKLLFNIYGGEIFMDSLSDEYFEAYKYLAEVFEDMVLDKLPNCHVEFATVTNATFKKKERVLKFLEETNGLTNISYDPEGRYLSEEQKELARENTKFFIDHDKVSMVTATITKPTIEAIITEKDTFLQDLPKHILFDLSYYLPMNVDNEKLTPSDDDMFRFFKYLLDNRQFNVSEINTIIMQYIHPDIESHSYCHNARISSRVNDQVIYNNCCYDMVRRFYEKGMEDYFGEYYSLIQNANEENKRLIGRERRHCLMCPWCDKCPGMCFIAVLSRWSDIGHCYLARSFEYLQEHPEIVEDYMQFDAGKLVR